jgi:hypothetical protein
MAKEGKRAADPQLLLLLACGATTEGAAHKTGVSVRTVRRRLRDPVFIRNLRRMRDEMQLRIADQLTAAGTEGVRTLVLLMQPTNSGTVRLGAARAVVELGLKVRETADLHLRLTAVEEFLAKRKGKRP